MQIKTYKEWIASLNEDEVDDDGFHKAEDDEESEEAPEDEPEEEPAVAIKTVQKAMQKIKDKFKPKGGSDSKSLKKSFRVLANTSKIAGRKSHSRQSLCPRLHHELMGSLH